MAKSSSTATPAGTSESSTSRWVPSPRLIAGAVLVVIAVVFVFENTRRTKIRFLVPEVSAPLWLALLITLVLGMAAGLLVARHRASSS